MHAYSVVYEAAPKLGPTLGGVAFGLIFVIIGLSLALSKGQPGSADEAASRNRAAFGWVFFAFASLWSLTVFTLGYTQWWDVRRAQNEGTALVVTGKVEGLDMTLERAPSVWFKVAGKDFRFQGDKDTARFRQPEDKWPIRQGQEVRLSYVCPSIDWDCLNPVILRLETLTTPDVGSDESAQR